MAMAVALLFVIQLTRVRHAVLKREVTLILTTRTASRAPANSSYSFSDHLHFDLRSMKDQIVTLPWCR